jgi:hypothetical protein
VRELRDLAARRITRARTGGRFGREHRPVDDRLASRQEVVVAARRPRGFAAAARDERDVVVVLVFFVVTEDELCVVVEDEQRFFFGLFLFGFVGMLAGVEAGAGFFGAEDAHSFDGRTFVVVQVAHGFLNLSLLTLKG